MKRSKQPKHKPADVPTDEAGAKQPPAPVVAAVKPRVRPTGPPKATVAENKRLELQHSTIEALAKTMHPNIKLPPETLLTFGHIVDHLLKRAIDQTLEMQRDAERQRIQSTDVVTALHLLVPPIYTLDPPPEGDSTPTVGLVTNVVTQVALNASKSTDHERLVSMLIKERVFA